MVKASSRDEYLIFRPERIGFLDILRLLFTRRSLTDYHFVESSPHLQIAAGGHDLKASWVVPLTLLLQKILSTISTPMKYAGIVVEFLLNFLYLNGGIFRLLFRIITVSVKIPKRDSVDYRSILAFVDGRVELYKSKALINYFPLMCGTPLQSERMMADFKPLDLSMMAAKIAYENPAYIQDVISNHWKMHFVKFFDCWNKFMSTQTTQAFVFCDKATDASLICLAFRGTEPFSADDWSTDVDLSYISMPLVGNVHLGFMKALGLQDEKNFLLGFPKEHATGNDEGKPLAYYAIREQLTSLLKEHPNASVLVTGHSLGAALACLFPTLLAYHGQQDILGRVHGVLTHAQPRVGDALFATNMGVRMATLNYNRMVFRYDVVPRVPLETDVIGLPIFKHFGSCIYYKSWYQGQMVIEVPNPNYFDPMYTIPMYWNAWGDLFRGLFAGKILGKDYSEGLVSILFRVVGLIVPGIASHSPRDYVNAGRLASIAPKEDMV